MMRQEQLKGVAVVTDLSVHSVADKSLKPRACSYPDLLSHCPYNVYKVGIETLFEPRSRRCSLNLW